MGIASWARPWRRRPGKRTYDPAIGAEGFGQAYSVLLWACRFFCGNSLAIWEKSGILYSSMRMRRKILEEGQL